MKITKLEIRKKCQQSAFPRKRNEASKSNQMFTTKNFAKMPDCLHFRRISGKTQKESNTSHFCLRLF